MTKYQDCSTTSSRSSCRPHPHHPETPSPSKKQLLLLPSPQLTDTPPPYPPSRTMSITNNFLHTNSMWLQHNPNSSSSSSSPPVVVTAAPSPATTPRHMHHHHHHPYYDRHTTEKVRDRNRFQWDQVKSYDWISTVVKKDTTETINPYSPFKNPRETLLQGMGRTTSSSSCSIGNNSSSSSSSSSSGGGGDGNNNNSCSSSSMVPKYKNSSTNRNTKTNAKTGINNKNNNSWCRDKLGRRQQEYHHHHHHHHVHFFECTVVIFCLAAVLGLTSNLFTIGWTDPQYTFSLEQFSSQRILLPTTTTTTTTNRNDSTIFTTSPLQHPYHRVLYRSYHEATIQTTIATPIPMDGTRATSRTTDSTHHRPTMYIHVGPYHTSSMTLQTDLTFYQDRLAQDNIVYLGKYDYNNNIDRATDPLTNLYSRKKMEDTALQKAMRNMFDECWHDSIRECVEDVRIMLLLQIIDQRPYHALPNVLIVDELFANHFESTNNNNSNTNQTLETPSIQQDQYNQNYVLLQEVLGQDWDLVIVSAYCRFYEWLPTNKYEMDQIRLMHSTWQSSRLGPLFPQSIGTATVHHTNQTNAEIFSLIKTQTLITNTTNKSLWMWRQRYFFSEKSIQTLHLLAKAHKNFDVRLYHLYGKVPIRTHFLCHVLRAEYSCRASQLHDTIKVKTNNNDNGTTVTEYPITFFDVIAMTALPWINTTKWDNRPMVAKMLQDQYNTASKIWYQQRQEYLSQTIHLDDSLDDDASLINDDVLIDDDDYVDDEDDGDGIGDDDDSSWDEVQTMKEDSAQDSNPWEIPLLCPTKEQLDQLLYMSLSLESKFVPKLYRKSSLEQHRAVFASTNFPNNNGILYCWVNVHAILHETSIWKKYIVETFSDLVATTE